MTRWNRRLLFGAIAVLVPALAGCEAGFNAPTLDFHPANFGVNTAQNGIIIDDAFVLGPTPGSVLPPGEQAGVFLSIQAQNGDRLVSVSAPDTASAVRIDGGSVDLPAQSVVDLSGPVPRVVLTGLTSPLNGGGTVQLSLNFAEAGTISLVVPVEPHAYEYATFAPPPVLTPTTTASEKAHPPAGGSASASVSASPPATP